MFAEIQKEVAGSQRKLVVIDDDPTGTQTVHDIEVFTTWNKRMLAETLQNGSRLFYLLTNSRSIPESDAVQYIGLIETCFAWGFSSALVDGSHLPFAENIAFTKRAVELAARYGGTIESEPGYLAGTEDGLTVEEIESSLTDPTKSP